MFERFYLWFLPSLTKGQFDIYQTAKPTWANIMEQETNNAITGKIVPKKSCDGVWRLSLIDEKYTIKSRPTATIAQGLMNNVT